MSSCHDCDDCFVCVLSVLVASLYQSCLLPVPGFSRRLDNALSFGATRWARTLQLRWKMASAMILSLNVFLCKMLQWKVEDVFRLRNIPSLECLNIRKGRVCFLMFFVKTALPNNAKLHWRQSKPRASWLFHVPNVGLLGFSYIHWGMIVCEMYMCMVMHLLQSKVS